MAVEGMNLTQVRTALLDGGYPSKWNTELMKLTQKGLSTTEFASEVSRVTDGYVNATVGKNGNIIGYTLKGNLSATSEPLINSNASTVSRSVVKAPVTTTVEAGSTTVKAGQILKMGQTKPWAYVANSVAAPLVAVGTGITLGKTIDSLLYNANPDFWDSNGMSSLNPATWGNITANNDSLAAGLFNMIFGIDPDTGNYQGYIDENAFAYMASYMQSMGVFNVSSGTIDSAITGVDISPLTTPKYFTYGTRFVWAHNYRNRIEYTIYTTNIPVYCVCVSNTTANGFCFYICSTTPFSYGSTDSNNPDSSPTVSTAAGSYSYNGQTFYALLSVRGGQWNGASYPNLSTVIINENAGIQSANNMYLFAYTILFGDRTSGITGITDQPNATTPQNLTGSVPNDLQLLQQQYPDLWNNAIDYPVIQSDGTVTNYKYVPINIPQVNGNNYTQPVSGNETQTNTGVNPDTAIQQLIDTLTNIIVNPYPETEPYTDNPPIEQNPIDTGDGSSPVPVVPVGSASALWKIYHPTQAQVDSFGGWLWSSNFIDQILKIFNNPMEAVIGLHKVYATPVDAGTTTIKVGYLDSQVPSAYIEQQYINVSCGSISLYEQFGNVFDYSPFTDIQLYLPFIGIVPLNVNDVMRSIISIDYGVDVITGACLAQVEIERDNNTSVLYQYSGNCAVQYPISSGSYMGIVSSIISVAGGVAATVASGGAAAPLALGAAGGLLNAHTSVQHSGGFSGNSGAMGGKIPYLIITRPQTKVAYNAEILQGYPTNDYITIGECTGYIKADSVHVINANATEEELTEINNLLLSGIII